MVGGLPWRALALAVGVLASAPVVANPMDTYGYTARAQAMGGAMTALASSFDATWYNPAGLTRVQGFEAGFGLSLRRTLLTVRRSTLDAAGQRLQRVHADHGRTTGALDLGLASPIPLGSGLERVLFVGASVMVPGPTLYAIRERPVEEPIFPFFEERNDTLVVNLAVAARWRWLALGAGVSFLPSVKGTVDVDFTDGDRRNRTEVDVGTSLAPTAGLLFSPGAGWSVGLSWRGENRLDLAIPVSVVVSSKIQPIDLTVTAVDHSTPHQVSLGVGWQRDGWEAGVDATYSVYRRFRAPFPDVTLLSSSASDGAALTSTSPTGGFHDTWAVHVGGQAPVAQGVAVRAGCAWVQSPVPPQDGATNLLDGDRYTGSLGVGVDVAEFGGPALVFDLAVAGGAMVGNRDEKTTLDPGNPGYPWIEGQGGYIVASFSTLARF